jgi:hypothetical protein
MPGRHPEAVVTSVQAPVTDWFDMDLAACDGVLVQSAWTDSATMLSVVADVGLALDRQLVNTNKPARPVVETA